ncbi:MAG: 50S ribosomal protein L6 [Syntrophales bacterium]|jgi:large subunit ribosomal protein L6|nr:50S ribosomal protein L6 [Syntrophales bacterium]MCK9527877.1 50S ribosomal protein L6 [Syntrophales bacterium]MDX9921949.1 50S ribosomal protein L6 [Syntrophales bacterium]
MSRIGKEPITVPDNVTVVMEDGLVRVDGPKGSLTRTIPGEVELSVDGSTVMVVRRSDDRRVRAYQGLARTLVANMVQGVSRGYEKKLEIVGVGYRGEVEGSVLKLLVGFSKPVEYKIPEGITVTVERQLNLTIGGIDKELVGKVAAEIRGIKKPEPYKGKGIRYAGETVRRKVGKSAGS